MSDLEEETERDIERESSSYSDDFQQSQANEDVSYDVVAHEASGVSFGEEKHEKSVESSIISASTSIQTVDKKETALNQIETKTQQADVHVAIACSGLDVQSREKRVDLIDKKMNEESPEDLTVAGDDFKETVLSESACFEQNDQLDDSKGGLDPDDPIPSLTLNESCTRSLEQSGCDPLACATGVSEDDLERVHVVTHSQDPSSAKVVQDSIIDSSIQSNAVNDSSENPDSPLGDLLHTTAHHEATKPEEAGNQLEDSEHNKSSQEVSTKWIAQGSGDSLVEQCAASGIPGSVDDLGGDYHKNEECVDLNDTSVKESPSRAMVSVEKNAITPQTSNCEQKKRRDASICTDPDDLVVFLSNKFGGGDIDRRNTMTESIPASSSSFDFSQMRHDSMEEYSSVGSPYHPLSDNDDTSSDEESSAIPENSAAQQEASYWHLMHEPDRKDDYERFSAQSRNEAGSASLSVSVGLPIGVRPPFSPRRPDSSSRRDSKARLWLGRESISQNSCSLPWIPNSPISAASSQYIPKISKRMVHSGEISEITSVPHRDEASIETENATNETGERAMTTHQDDVCDDESLVAMAVDMQNEVFNDFQFQFETMKTQDTNISTEHRMYFASKLQQYSMQCAYYHLHSSYSELVCNDCELKSSLTTGSEEVNESHGLILLESQFDEAQSINLGKAVLKHLFINNTHEEEHLQSTIALGTVNAESLHQAASSAVENLDTVMSALVENQLCWRSPVLVKPVSSIAAKAKRKYDGNVLRVKDLVRSYIVCERASILLSVLSRLSSICTRGQAGIQEVCRVKNLFCDECADRLSTGYRHVLVTIRLADGLLGEVQLHLKRYFDVFREKGYILHRKISEVEMRERTLKWTVLDLDKFVQDSTPDLDLFTMKRHADPSLFTHVSTEIRFGPDDFSLAEESVSRFSEACRLWSEGPAKVVSEQLDGMIYVGISAAAQAQCDAPSIGCASCLCTAQGNEVELYRQNRRYLSHVYKERFSSRSRGMLSWLKSKALLETSLSSISDLCYQMAGSKHIQTVTGSITVESTPPKSNSYALFAFAATNDTLAGIPGCITSHFYSLLEIAERAFLSHVTKQPSCGQSGRALFVIEDGYSALEDLRLHVGELERAAQLDNSLHGILLGDAHSVLANCASIAATSWGLRTDRTVLAAWQQACLSYRNSLVASLKRGVSMDSTTASAAYGVARCLRELDRPEEAIKLLSNLLASLESLPMRQQSNTKRRLGRSRFRLSSSQPEDLSHKIRTSCLWLMAISTLDMEPSKEGREKALRILHTSVLSLKHALADNSSKETPSSHDQKLIIRLIEEEAKRIAQAQMASSSGAAEESKANTQDCNSLKGPIDPEHTMDVAHSVGR